MLHCLVQTRFLHDCHLNIIFVSQILRDMRRPSARHCLSKESVRFRIIQLVVNVVVLIAIGIALAIYLKSTQKGSFLSSNYEDAVFIFRFLVVFAEVQPEIRYINRSTPLAITPNEESTFAGASSAVVGANFAKLGVPGPGAVVSSRCMPVNVPLCLKHRVPYNYTSFPNFFDQISQREAAAVSTQFFSFMTFSAVHNYQIDNWF